MQAFARIAIAAAAAAVFIPAVAGEIQFYGRAGGPVGAERVARIASYVSPRDLREFDSGDGRAGGPVAAAPVSYGRVGSPG